METNEALERRIINLESIIAEQDRLLDALNEEILRLNRLHERLLVRLEAHEAKHEADLNLRPLSDEPPPPHY